MYKKALYVFAILALQPLAMNAQENNYNGEWMGNIYIQQREMTAWKRVTIDNHTIVKYEDGRHKERWYQSMKFEVAAIPDSFQFAWTSNCRFGNEQEIFTLQAISTDTLLVKWMRKCEVYANHKKVAADTWQLYGTGYFIKVKQGDHLLTSID